MSDKPKSAEELAIPTELLDERTLEYYDKWIILRPGRNRRVDSCVIGGFQAGWKDGYTCGYERGKAEAEALQEGTAEYRLGFVRSKAEVGGWIKCSERLPEKRTWKLVFIPDPGDVRMAYLAGNQWLRYGDEYKLEPTHWMPLPDEPGGER